LTPRCVSGGAEANFLGIVIRKVAIPGKDSPALHKQFLLGLVTIGLIIEHGMLLNERVTKFLASGQPDIALPSGGSLT
jgi:hypothetical protein